MKYPGYEPELICAKANMGHTISGQGTTISISDHSTSTLSLTSNTIACDLDLLSDLLSDLLMNYLTQCLAEIYQF